MAILLSSHLLNQVQHVCDRIGIFSFGRLIGQGSMSELASKFGEDVALIEAGIEVTDRAGSDRVREVLTGIPNVVEVTGPSDRRAVAHRRPPASEGPGSGGRSSRRRPRPVST
jgi:ABC-2 type transport system ATP-binding protein